MILTCLAEGEIWITADIPGNELYASTSIIAYATIDGSEGIGTIVSDGEEEVFNLNGLMIYSGDARGIKTLAPGTYLIRANGTVTKINKK
ncbi:MAG: hypothetical protein LIP09_13300 [Bacteroidales bacterium]|nr:hypothetical protein [Bacteroidales bacterium]